MHMTNYEHKPDAPRTTDDILFDMLRSGSAGVALVGVVVAVVLTLVLLAAGGAATPVSLLGLGLTGGIISLAWLDNRADRLGKEHSWSRLAEQTGLTYTAGRILMGQGVYVSGTYRERPLSLSTRRQGKGQVQSTRIELQVHNLEGARLRMRGPFLRGAVEVDTVTSDLFGTTQARPFGDDRRFFIRSHPLHLATMLVSTQPLWDELLALEPLTNIELEEHILSFERLGVLRDTETLNQLFDVLSTIADVLEQQAAPLLDQRGSGNPANAHTMSIICSTEASPNIR
jgi:hypothetical protein